MLFACSQQDDISLAFVLELLEYWRWVIVDDDDDVILFLLTKPMLFMLFCSDSLNTVCDTACPSCCCCCCCCCYCCFPAAAPATSPLWLLLSPAAAAAATITAAAPYQLFPLVSLLLAMRFIYRMIAFRTGQSFLPPSERREPNWPSTHKRNQTSSNNWLLPLLTLQQLLELHLRRRLLQPDKTQSISIFAK